MGPLCLCCSLYGGPNNSDNDGDDSTMIIHSIVQYIHDLAIVVMITMI